MSWRRELSGQGLFSGNAARLSPRSAPTTSQICQSGAISPRNCPIAHAKGDRGAASRGKGLRLQKNPIQMIDIRRHPARQSRLPGPIQPPGRYWNSYPCEIGEMVHATGTVWRCARRNRNCGVRSRKLGTQSNCQTRKTDTSRSSSLT